MVAPVHQLFPGVKDPSLVANPDTVHLLRTRKGFTLAYMAEQVGKKTPWASKIESGGLSLSGPLLDSYAAILGVPAIKLTEELTPVAAEGMAFRKNKVPQKTADKLQSEAAVRLDIITSLLHLAHQRQAPLFPQFDVDLFDHGATAAAWKIRERWGVVGPVRNLAGHLEAEGAFLSDMPAEVRKVAAVTAWPSPDSAPVMMISAREPTNRRRFSIAHELGHMIMDRHSRSCTAKDVEARADEFAGELLAPYSLVRDAFLQLRPGDVQSLLPLQSEWGMHPAAFVQRARLHEDISKEDTSVWYRALNGPFRSLIASTPPSFPLRFSAFSDLIQLLKDYGWHPQAIANHVNFYTPDIIDIAGKTNWPFTLPNSSATPTRHLEAV